MKFRHTLRGDDLNRRHLVASIGTLGVTGLAGCTGGDSTSQSRETTDEETATNTPEENREAEFEIVSIVAPDEVEVGQHFGLSFEVKNVGDADGTWVETLSEKVGDYEWREFDVLEMDIPAGETRTLSIRDIWLSLEATISYRLENAGREFSIEFIPADLYYGNTFLTYDSMEVTAVKAEFSQTYEYETMDGGTAIKEASEGSKWVFVHFRAENKSDDVEFAPSKHDIRLIAGNSQYDWEVTTPTQQEYEGGDIEPGIVREGVLLFNIPVGLSKEDFEVSWTDGNYYGEWTVRWSA